MIAKPLLSNQRKCDIYFRSSGQIDISASVVKSIGLQSGDVINLTMIEEELYLYPSVKASNITNEHVRYKNAVRPSKKGYNHCRCQSKMITDFMESLTGSKESWLFVGKTKDLSQFGIYKVGINLIYKNNQYNGN